MSPCAVKFALDDISPPKAICPLASHPVMLPVDFVSVSDPNVARKV